MKIVIAGFGEVGYVLYRKLRKEHRLCVIDSDAEALEKIDGSDNLTRWVSDISDSGLYEAPAFRNPDIFYAVSHSDEHNLLACKLAKEKGAGKTVCRTEKISWDFDGETDKFRELGVDVMVNLNEVLAGEFYRLVQAPQHRGGAPPFRRRNLRHRLQNHPPLHLLRPFPAGVRATPAGHPPSVSLCWKRKMKPTSTWKTAICTSRKKTSSIFSAA